MTVPFPPFPPFPANPTVGQQFGSWVWNGAAWIPSTSGGMTLVVQVFTTVGQTLTYIPSPGLVSVMVECVGGGGGGGDAYSSSGTVIVSGGGGGSGGYSKKALAAALVLGGVNVTIGAGGAGGGTPGTGAAAGANGGTTSFGALCVANGGFGGGNNDGGPGGYVGAPGNPGGPGIGDITWPGEQGMAGQIIVGAAISPQSTAGGRGGSIMGGGSLVTIVGTGAQIPGVAAYPNTGAGGSGAVNNQSVQAVGASGGAGGSGICIATEYCLGGAGGGCGQAPIPITDGSCLGWGPC